MSITSNDGGVLKTLNAVTANDGGVLHELNTVHANEDGVFREIHSAKKVKIEGITPLVEGDGFMVIVNSGNFTLSAPAGTSFILAGGGEDGCDCYGGSGGYTKKWTTDSDINNAACTLTLGENVEYVSSNKKLTASSLKIGTVTYLTETSTGVISTKWGAIGGKGGNGGSIYMITSTTLATTNAESPTGAGGGGGGAYFFANANGHTANPSKGGGTPYKNCGGDGGAANKKGSDGSSGIGGARGTMAGNVGGGGGGGYGSGGGGAGGYISSGGTANYGTAGQGGKGILVIEW